MERHRQAVASLSLLPLGPGEAGVFVGLVGADAPDDE